MPRFRKKPVVISAEQYTGPATVPQHHPRPPVPVGVTWSFNGVVLEEGSYVQHVRPTIETLEGLMTVSPGDWVITGVVGEKYPCRCDVFTATYEPVDDE